MRDRLIVRACNALLRLATPKYRALLRGSIAYGLHAAARHQECDCETVV